MKSSIHNTMKVAHAESTDIHKRHSNGHIIRVDNTAYLSIAAAAQELRHGNLMGMDDFHAARHLANAELLLVGSWCHLTRRDSITCQHNQLFQYIVLCKDSVPLLVRDQKQEVCEGPTIGKDFVATGQG